MTFFAVDIADVEENDLVDPSIIMNPYVELNGSNHFTVPLLLKLISCLVSLSCFELSIEVTGASEIVVSHSQASSI